jgi:hypothetical protein
MYLPDQFALGQDGRLSLWCRNKGMNPDGGINFWVINGHWDGVWKDGEVYVNATKGLFKAELYWMGTVPFSDSDYNEAMNFIRELNWSFKMTTQKMTLSGIQNEATVVEHNSVLLNLAKLLKNNEEHAERLKREAAQVEERIQKINALALDPELTEAKQAKLLESLQSSFATRGFAVYADEFRIVNN